MEKQIADWRRTMAKESKHRPEALDELEAHLREEIERLVRGGTSTDRAFEFAVSKLGSAGALGAEFDKLEEMRRAKWKPATLAQWGCIAVAILVAALLIPRIGHGRMTPLLASHVLSIAIGYLTMFIIGGLAICYVLADWLQQTGPAQRYALRRAAFRLATVATILTATGIVLGMIWAKQNWGRYWAWDPKETGGVMVLLCGTVSMALRWLKLKGHRAIVVMGILGNIGVAWGWFGVNAATESNPILIAFIAGHCLLLAGFFTTSMRKRALAS